MGCKKIKTGTLYGIGVGPGDPELITLKAVNILKRVAVVFAAASTKNNYSVAMEIVSPHLQEDVPVEHLGFPMSLDRKELARAWKDNALKVLKILKQGKDAAFVTLGDPLIYSTFGYLMQTIKGIEPDISVQAIPGITSFQAGAASAGMVLTEGEESLTLFSGALGADKLRQTIGHTDNMVMLKVYRNYKEIMDTLDQLDLIDKSVLISRCGLDGEEVIKDIQSRSDTAPPYLSLLLIKKNR